LSNKLTNLDYCAAAQKLNCEVAAIKAVAAVESAGDGFLPSGKVKILFERHHFARLTNHQFDNSHPQISSRSAGGYYGNEKEYQRFNEAYELNPKAAMMSCSWGKFQIMGFNYAVCGFTSIGDFVDAMKRGEGEQLLAFCGFCETNNLDDDLRRKDWKGFARGYNGKSYTINNYDGKMANAYARFKAENIDCNKLPDLKDDEINLEIPTISAAVSANNPADSSPSDSSDSPAAASNVSEQNNQLTDSNEQPPLLQKADQITNIDQSEKNVPDNFVPEQKIVEAPPKEGSTAAAAQMTIAGFAVPTFLIAIIKTIQDLIAQGFVNAADVGNAVIGFIVSNQKYVFYLVVAIIALLIVKKLTKQITLWIKMFIVSDPNRHDVEVVQQ
jgi:hypothetical protein